ncbi:FAD/NAD(P)-binding domain-containing protein [Nadsonia fulvescens var. elongata DSM 6958]|uniref:FAD/NAD(P)-binding domain-containing protein n=1 Tax=Nadsonia fulvescens var. elongata DSM 6958 TaxID=857566 RepID=A0A1E3PMA0_9ASCO|nr:FAD/NAD(P)-binding domain-containing protein [Nadsonia fulvescens var. elongata DSM 6958]
MAQSETFVHNIVILGSSYAGLTAAHLVFKKVIPSVANLVNTANKTYKVTIISPSDNFFGVSQWPRALTDNSFLDENKIIEPFTDKFDQYKNGAFEHVKGIATGTDFESKVVQVKGLNGTVSVEYDTLIISVGTSSHVPYIKMNDSIQQSDALKDAIIDLRGKIKKAKTITVGGAGVTGIEVAADIADFFPEKNVSLYSSASTVFPLFGDKVKVINAAESQLKNLKVNVVHNTKVISVEDKDGQQELTLSSGEKHLVDLYIAATGLTSNAGFLPEHVLDNKKKINVDDRLRVVNSIGKVIEGVYAFGDSISGGSDTIVDIKLFQTGPLVASLTDNLSEGFISKPKTYKKGRKETILAVIGRGGGTGLIFGWKAPSFAVKMLKSKDYMVGSLKGFVSGAEL